MEVKIKDITESKYSFLQLEKWIEDNKSNTMTFEELMELFSKDFTQADVLYLIDAYRMPRKEIEEALNIYQNSSPKMDELKFVSDLSSKYSVDRQTIIRRIQEVIIARRTEKEQNEVKITKKTKK